MLVAEEFSQTASDTSSGSIGTAVFTMENPVCEKARVQALLRSPVDLSVWKALSSNRVFEKPIFFDFKDLTMIVR